MPNIYPKLVVMAIMWSGVFAATKIALASIEVFTAVFLRFWCGAVLLMLLLVRRERRLPRVTGRQAALILVLALLGITVYNALFNLGLSLVEASRAALIVPTNPAFTALFAWLIFRERMNGARAAGVLLSVGGALWVITRGEPAQLLALSFGRGELYLILCMFTWTFYTLLGRVALVGLSALALTAYTMLVGSVGLAALAALEPGSLADVTPASWTALGYLVVFGTVIPFLWYYEGVKAIGAARAAQFISLVPPLAVAESVVLLGEPFSGALVAGAALVIAGLVLTNRPAR
ncbi:MAG: DMT family transporter [Burkholderiales bacterium]|nr:DMT family transporter [Burkholderiales bacterium]